MSTRLLPVRDVPDNAVMNRAVILRGQDQLDALRELDRRGLWLTTAQRREAGLIQWRYIDSIKTEGV